MKKCFFLILPCLWMIACATDGKTTSSMPLSATVISSSLHCRPASDDWTVTLVNSDAMLELMASKIDAHLVGASSKKVPTTDFNEFYVIAIEMGRKPTAGFGIDAKKITASLEDRVAIIQISWQQPSSDMLMAQMLTSPCVLVLLTRGAYDRILVKDQENQIVGQLTAESKR